MPRTAHFSVEQILDAAADLVASGGPNAATIGAIGQVLKAPSGSIYHRFASRGALLGQLWLVKAAGFQARFAAALAHDDTRAACEGAALSIPRAVRADPAGARVMLLHRREDFLTGDWPAPLRAEARRLEAQAAEALSGIGRRVFGAPSQTQRRALAFALLDAPMAAVRRHITANEPVPASVDALLRLTIGAVLEPHLKRKVAS